MGKSDPYVKVRFGDMKDEYRTRTIRRNLNPVWNARFQEQGEGVFAKVPQIKFMVFANDFIGGCSIATDICPRGHYSTPVQWINLSDKEGGNLKGPNGKQSAIQVQVKYTLHAVDLDIAYYTHVMEFTIKKGTDIRNKELIGLSDPYVKLEWGSQNYLTKVIKGNLNPQWNETAYLFVHSKFHSKYQVRLSVMNKDLTADEHLGTGYISAEDVFKQCGLDGSKTYNHKVELREVVMFTEVAVRKNKEVNDFKDADVETFKKHGHLEVEIKLKPREIVENEFYGALVHTFDANNDGVIDKDEVCEMFAELKMPEEDAEEFFQKFDENNDMKLDEKEVKKMLHDSEFQGSELATQLMAIYLGGHLNNDYQMHLMSGFTHDHTSTSQVIKIKDRETGLLVQEFVPNYVWYALKLVYDIKLNRTILQSTVANKLLAQMSKKRGTAMDDAESRHQIRPFIKQHNLDERPILGDVDDFKTFNDFFARGIDADAHRPLALPADDNVISSPADCRMMLWDSILDSTQVWIKGSRFTLESLCGSGDHRVDLNKYHGGAFVIARLAPQDYHRWHYPLSGTVVNIHAIDGALYTVNPIAINKPVDVYTKNKRAIVEVQNEKHGSYIMFVIAATMVGSYSLFKEDHAEPLSNNPIELKNGDKVQRGAVAGEFRFGGSTILLLFEKKIKINFDNDIERNVKHPFETLVNARSRIGRIV
eukprot:461395_1